MSEIKGKKVIYLENLTILEILSFIEGNLCNERMRYVSFGKNLRGAWERVLLDGRASTLYRAIEYGGPIPSFDVPKEVIDAIRPFLSEHAKLTEPELKEYIDIPYTKYKPDVFKDVLSDSHFDRFRKGLLTYLNRRWSDYFAFKSKADTGKKPQKK